MKKYLVLAIFLVLGSAIAAAPSLSLDYEVTPSSINPGGSAQVIVTVTSLEALVEVDDVDIILIARGSSGVFVTSSRSDLGTLSPLSTSSGAFAIKARDNAEPGTYILEANGDYEFGSDSGSFKLNIPVTVSYRSGLEISATDTEITPGGTETVLITIQNSGKGTIKDVILALSSTSNSVYPVGNFRNSIGDITAGEIGEVSFQIKASDSASVGIQPLGITMTYTDASGTTQTDVDSVAITIVDAGTEVVIDSVESTLEAGKVGTVKIGIKNVGESNLDDLYFSLATGTEVTTAVGAAFLSIRGANEKIIDSLAVGEIKCVEFEFDVSQDAEAFPVMALLTVNYQREGGKTQIMDSKPLGIVIGGTPDLRIVDTETDLGDKEIEIDIANYGNKDASAIKIELMQGGEVISTGFTDQIKPNKHKVFRFDLPTKTSIVVRMSYKDYEAEGEITIIEESVSLEGSEITPPATDQTMTYLFVLVLVIVAIWYFRKRGKDSKNIDVSKYK